MEHEQNPVTMTLTKYPSEKTNTPVSLDSTDREPFLRTSNTPQQTSASHRSYKRFIYPVLLALLSTIVLAQWIQLHHHGLPVFRRFTYTVGVDLPQNVPRLIHAPSDFISRNSTWDEIDAGHGVVALNTEWAQRQGLPKTMAHPRDPTKSIYTIAAYHSIHCLKFVRQHYLKLIAGEEVKWDIEHDMHCFDGLRQMIMCDANSNLLWSSGRKDVGHGQTVMCRNWDALREWATENTACYSDLPYPSKITRWGRCDGGDDGLPRGSLLA